MPNAIGFIGLGLMGQGMTKCLKRAGYQVTGFDINPAMNDLAAKHGVTIVPSAQAVAEVSEIIEEERSKTSSRA